MLPRAAQDITMAEVVEALEGSIAPIECISEASDGSIVCARESGRAGSDLPCPTKLLWTRVRFSIVSTLRETTLADLLRGTGGEPLPTGPTLPALELKPIVGAPLSAEPLTTEPLTSGA
jgi:DNA-binding IscR family transcriptional regulator